MDYSEEEEETFFSEDNVILSEKKELNIFDVYHDIDKIIEEYSYDEPYLFRLTSSDVCFKSTINFYKNTKFHYNIKIIKDLTKCIFNTIQKYLKKYNDIENDFGYFTEDIIFSRILNSIHKYYII